MEFSEYMDGAAQTMPEELGSRDLLADAALGMCGEAGEILEVLEGLEPAELDDELGDGWWYVAAAYHALEIRPAEVTEATDAPEVERLDLFRAACRVAECAKKVRYHHDPLEEHRDAILAGLRIYATVLSSLSDTADAEIWRANIAKLADRYPEGFVPGGGER